MNNGAALTLVPGNCRQNSLEEYQCDDYYEGDGFRTVLKTTLSRHFDMPKTATLAELLALDGVKLVNRFKA